ncbi:protein of unknown function [Methylocaldum szegediense]|uniref:Uncharacterized protein n=1 Tax=Methylocaldum szegediense TaxID=73780 RepID=A0ABM9HW15_9GAMM|nr:protein of unknown function [Methylocaldum szegediense]
MRGGKHDAVPESAKVPGVKKVKEHASYSDRDVGSGNNTG